MGRVHRLRQVAGNRLSAEETFPEIDGSSPAIVRLKEHLACVARDPDVTVLLLGESGTGKERIARAIHRASPRCALSFQVIDCATLATTLADDQLFGHVRGAFTGAVHDRASPFERASGGTLLLDEVGDLSLDMQMKLLRAIQSRTIQRLGAVKDTRFDVRLIAATNIDLARATAQGRFRQDLYYRLNVYEVVVPPLRERGAADIAALTTAILAQLSSRRRRPAPAIEGDALEILIRHDWPGNVRELENTLERMLVASAGESLLRRRHLPDGLGTEQYRRTHRRRLPWPSLADALEALEKHQSRVARAAADLGVSRHQLYRLLKRHGRHP